MTRKYKARCSEDARRIKINQRLPLRVIEAINQAAGENGTCFTDEVEARLVETLIADGLITKDDATEVCGSYAGLAACLTGME